MYICLKTTMKNYYLLFGTLLLLQLACFGQTLPEILTQEHQLIKGTNIHLVPPPSFSASDNFKGFQDPNDPYSMLMVVEIPGPFSEVTEGFKAELMAPRGMQLLEKQSVTIGPYDGYLLQVDQAAGEFIFSKHILIYGDEKASTLLNAVFLKTDDKLGKALRESIMTTYIDTELNVNPRAALQYQVDETQGKLLFHSVIGNAMLFNRDLKTPTESTDKAALIVDQSFNEVEVNDREAFCLERLAKFNDPYTLNTSNGKGIEAIEIDGLPGYELRATSTTGEEELLQVILFTEGGGYYILVGTYQKGYNEAYQDIRRVMMTFQRKSNEE